MKLFRLLCVPVLVLSCSAESIDVQRQAALVSPDLVISQVYGGGGNASATYTHDFVEIFNRGSSPVQLQGYSIQYASTAANFVNNNMGLAVDLPNFSLQPGQYFLIQLASNGMVGAPLPMPDAIGTTDMSATAGKVALVPTMAKLNACGALNDCNPNSWVDLVGYGTTASQYEGSGKTANLSSTKSALRQGGGCIDTGDNAADFTTPVPVARNSASNKNVCVLDAGSDAAGDGEGGVIIDGGADVDLDAAVDASFDADLDAGADADDGSMDASDAGADADDGSVDAGADADDGSTDAAADADLDGGADGGDAAVDGGADGGDASVDGGDAGPPPLLAISQAFGGGGNSGAPYTHDFVEILNRGNAPVQLQGYSLQYTSASGTFSTSNTFDFPMFTLQPGQYFLVQLASGGNNGMALPMPDGTSTTNLGSTAGKLALVASSQKLVGCGTQGTPCAKTWVDLVGYGGSAEQYEGSGPAPAPSNTLADKRAMNGCVDTDDNAADFSTGAPTPRNSSNTAVCSGDGGVIGDGGMDAAPPMDSGVKDSGPGDGSMTGDAMMAPDAPVSPPDGSTDGGGPSGSVEGGCSCNQSSEPPWSAAGVLAALAVMLGRRRARSGARV